MKNTLLILGLLVFCGTTNAQRFTLDKHLIEDSISLHDYSYGKIDLTSNTSDSMSIKIRVFKNTVDNYAFNTSSVDTSTVHLLYGTCGHHSLNIRNEGICEVSKNWSNPVVGISDLTLETKDSIRSMELCLEFFDVLDSTFRDTACYRFYAKNTLRTGITSHQNVSEMKIFPNPAATSITIATSINIKSIQIIELSGKVVLMIDKVQSSNKTLDLTSIETGLFILRVEDEKGKVINKKLMIQ